MADLSFLPDQPNEDLSFLPDQDAGLPPDAQVLSRKLVKAPLDMFSPQQDPIRAPRLTTPSDVYRLGDKPVPKSQNALESFLFKEELAPPDPVPSGLGGGLSSASVYDDTKKLASEATRPIAEGLAEPVDATKFPNVADPTGEARTRQKHDLLSGLSGLLRIFPRDVVEKIQKKSPIPYAIGSLGGLVGTGRATKGVFGATTSMKALQGLSSQALMIGGRMAQSGATFSLRKLITNIAEDVSGTDRTAKEFISSVVGEGAFGAGLGLAGSINNPLVRIPGQAAYGYVTSKIQGASDFEAGIAAAMFGAFGMMNRANLKGEVKKFALYRVERALAEQLGKAGAGSTGGQIISRNIMEELRRRTFDFKRITAKDIDAVIKNIRSPKPGPGLKQGPIDITAEGGVSVPSQPPPPDFPPGDVPIQQPPPPAQGPKVGGVQFGEQPLASPLVPGAPGTPPTNIVPLGGTDVMADIFGNISAQDQMKKPIKPVDEESKKMLGERVKDSLKPGAQGPLPTTEGPPGLEPFDLTSIGAKAGDVIDIGTSKKTGEVFIKGPAGVFPIKALTLDELKNLHKLAWHTTSQKVIKAIEDEIVKRQKGEGGAPAEQPKGPTGIKGPGKVVDLTQMSEAQLKKRAASSVKSVSDAAKKELKRRRESPDLNDTQKKSLANSTDQHLKDLMRGPDEFMAKAAREELAKRPEGKKWLDKLDKALADEKKGIYDIVTKNLEGKPASPEELADNMKDLTDKELTEIILEGKNPDLEDAAAEELGNRGKLDNSLKGIIDLKKEGQKIDEDLKKSMKEAEDLAKSIEDDMPPEKLQEIVKSEAKKRGVSVEQEIDKAIRTIKENMDKTDLDPGSRVVSEASIKQLQYWKKELRLAEYKKKPKKSPPPEYDDDELSAMVEDSRTMDIDLQRMPIEQLNKLFKMAQDEGVGGLIEAINKELSRRGLKKKKLGPLEEGMMKQLEPKITHPKPKGDKPFDPFKDMSDDELRGLMEAGKGTPMGDMAKKALERRAQNAKKKDLGPLEEGMGKDLGKPRNDDLKDLEDNIRADLQKISDKELQEFLKIAIHPNTKKLIQDEIDRREGLGGTPAVPPTPTPPAPPAGGEPGKPKKTYKDLSKEEKALLHKIKKIVRRYGNRKMKDRKISDLEEINKLMKKASKIIANPSVRDSLPHEVHRGINEAEKLLKKKRAKRKEPKGIDHRGFPDKGASLYAALGNIDKMSPAELSRYRADAVASNLGDAIIKLIDRHMESRGIDKTGVEKKKKVDDASLLNKSNDELLALRKKWASVQSDEADSIVEAIDRLLNKRGLDWEGKPAAKPKYVGEEPVVKYPTIPEGTSADKVEQIRRQAEIDALKKMSEAEPPGVPTLKNMKNKLPSMSVEDLVKLPGQTDDDALLGAITKELASRGLDSRGRPDFLGKTGKKSEGIKTGLEEVQNDTRDYYAAPVVAFDRGYEAIGASIGEWPKRIKEMGLEWKAARVGVGDTKHQTIFVYKKGKEGLVNDIIKQYSEKTALEKGIEAGAKKLPGKPFPIDEATDVTIQAKDALERIRKLPESFLKLNPNYFKKDIALLKDILKNPKKQRLATIRDIEKRIIAVTSKFDQKIIDDMIAEGKLPEEKRYPMTDAEKEKLYGKSLRNLTDEELEIRLLNLTDEGDVDKIADVAAEIQRRADAAKKTPLEEGMKKESDLTIRDTMLAMSNKELVQFRSDAVGMNVGKDILKQIDDFMAERGIDKDGNVIDKEKVDYSNEAAEEEIKRKLNKQLKDAIDKKDSAKIKETKDLAKKLGVELDVPKTPLEEGIAKDAAPAFDMTQLTTIPGDSVSNQQPGKPIKNKWGVFLAGGTGQPTTWRVTKEAAQEVADKLNAKNALRGLKSRYMVEQVRGEYIRADEKKKLLTKDKAAKKEEKKKPLSEEEKVEIEKGLKTTVQEMKGKSLGGKFSMTPEITAEFQALQLRQQEANAIKRPVDPVTKEVMNTPAYKKLLNQISEARKDLISTIMVEYDLDGEAGRKIAVQLVNKMSKMFRDLGGDIEGPIVGGGGSGLGEGGFVNIPGVSKRMRAARIRKLRTKREVDFARKLKFKIKKVMAAAKKAKLSVENYIKKNPKAFPEAPKNAESLQAALRQVFNNIPISIKDLKKGDIVMFRGAQAFGIVEQTGEVIKVRWSDGLGAYTPAEAIRDFRQTGDALRLRKLPRKKITKDIKKILANNPKHIQLAEIANASIDAALKNPDDQLVQAQATAVTSRLISAIIGKTIDINDIPSIVAHYEMSSPDFIKTLVQDIKRLSTEAGQVLNLLSQSSKKLKRILLEAGATPDEVNALFPEEPRIDPVSRTIRTLWGKANRGEQFRKGFLTSQLKTAARNFEVQAVMAFSEYIEDLIVLGVQKATGTGIKGKEMEGIKAYKNAIKSSTLDLLRFAKNLRKLNMKPKVRRRIYKLLDAFPDEKANLLRAPIQDVFIRGKIIETLNAVNILQEHFFRSMIVQQELTKFAARHETTIRNIPFFKQHMDKVIESVENGLLKTFSSNLKDVPLLGDVVEFFVRNPIIAGIAGNPFIRFFANNMYTLLGRKSPVKLLNLMSPEFRESLESPNNEKNLKHLAQGFMGFIVFATAMALRHKTFAGPKFYQIKIHPVGQKLLGKATGKKLEYFDTRPFSPLPQALFFVELAKNLMGNTNETRLTATDWFQGIAAVSRIAGTGLAMVDLIRAEPFTEKVDEAASAASRSRIIKNFIGQYISAPTVPLKQFQDIIGIFDPSENVYKSVQNDPLLGPSLNNIPWAKRLLPDLQEFGRAESRSKGRIAGGIEFFTGLRAQKLNAFEVEVARLGLSSQHPRSGDPAINQLIIDEMNEGMEYYGNLLVKDPGYKTMDDRTRRNFIKSFLSEAFTVGRDVVKLYTEEGQEFYGRKKAAQIEAKVHKKIGKKLLDIYLKVSGEDKEKAFSETKRELLRTNLK